METIRYSSFLLAVFKIECFFACSKRHNFYQKIFLQSVYTKKINYAVFSFRVFLN
ncbi:hypothetical protein D920_00856 [Enterococcus faecalis 13-SD-W-01]|nr:hypothetical protein D920_00856 [Enterococcus faecalis 13-SD-W-01]